MLESLSFGRPAATRVWAEGPVTLGRVTLAPDGTTPAKPELHRSGPITVAADLRLPDAPGEEQAHDALFQFLEQGAFPDSLDGDFAIAAWDSQRSELILARDRVGIRPLFFARPAGQELVFASFPDALIDAGVVEGRFRPRPVALRAMAAAAEGGPETLIAGVHRVLPGHVMTAGPEGERLRRYWQYPVDRVAEGDFDHESAACALRFRLEVAVNRTLPAQGPIFTHLSGGLDSATVTALAARLSGRAPAEITAAGFTLPESVRGLGEIAEEPTGAPVASKTGVTFLPIAADSIRDMFLSPLARTAVSSDHPGFTYNRFVALAAAHGADRVLCGFGGDEAVSYDGRGVVLGDFLSLRWRTLWNIRRELPEPLWRILANQLVQSFLAPGLEQRLRRAVKGSAPFGLNLAETVMPRFRALRRWQWPPIGAARMQRARLTKAGFFDRLELQARQAARRGLRYVFPLLDWRLLEFTATVPARLQLRGGTRRALFRTAVADLLPRETLERSKRNVVPAFTYQLAMHRDALIAEARRVAHSDAASAVIDVAEIERRLAAIPDPEKVAEQIRAAAAAGRPFRNFQAMSIVVPFLVARALAQNEADCAARQQPRSEVA